MLSRSGAVVAKYGDKSVYFDLEDLGNTTGQWDLYGSDAPSPYNPLQVSKILDSFNENCLPCLQWYLNDGFNEYPSIYNVFLLQKTGVIISNICYSYYIIISNNYCCCCCCVKNKNHFISLMTKQGLINCYLQICCLLQFMLFQICSLTMCMWKCRASSLRHLQLHLQREGCCSSSWYWEVGPP